MTPDESKVLINAWLKAKLDEDADIRDMPEGERHRITIVKVREPWRPDEPVRTLDQAALEALISRDPTLNTLYQVGEEDPLQDRTDKDLRREGFLKPLKDARVNRILDDTTIARPLVIDLFRQANVELDEQSDGFRAAVRFMLVALEQLAEASWQRDDVHWRRWSGHDPADALLQSLSPMPPLTAFVQVQPEQMNTTPPSAVPAAVTGARLSDAAESYIAESLNSRVFKQTRADEVRAAVRAFEGWLGKPGIMSDVTPAVAGTFRKDMAFYPSNAAKRPEYRNLTVPERIQKAKMSSESRVVSSVTLNGKYMDPLRGLWDWAISAGQTTGNPFLGIKVRVAKAAAKPAKRRTDFTSDHLKKLFGSTVFTGSMGDEGKRQYQPGPHRIDDWRYWLPLLALFTGARLNELCGLLLSDFDERDGVAFIHIRVSSEEQSLKSAAADRLVPVHTELTTLGLIERVNRLRSAKETKLFPNLTPGPRGYLSDAPSKFFGKLIDRMLGEDTNVVFHSFRHTFISALRRSGVERDVRTALVGHDEDDSIRNDVHDEYGEQAFNRLVEAVRNVDWPGLDLSAIRLPTP
jgi:integrase